MVVQYTDLVEKDYFGLAIRNYPFVADKKKKDRQGVSSPEITVDGQEFPPFVSGCHGKGKTSVLTTVFVWGAYVIVLIMI